MATKQLCWYDPEENSIELAEGKFTSQNQLDALALKTERERSMKRSDMNFVWFLFHYGDKIFKDMNISPSTIARLFYVATFCGYDNVLRSGKLALTKADIREKLNISKDQFAAFWNEVSSNGILITNDDGSISINDTFFSKGSVDKNVESNFTRIYCKFIREVYEQSDARSHKILSYFFRLIPYTNYRFNCICKNPYESERENIAPMTVGEYCEKLDYTVKNGKRLLQQMLDFTVNGEHLICMFGFSLNVKKNFLMINPRLFYSHNQFDEISEQFKLSSKRESSVKQIE